MAGGSAGDGGFEARQAATEAKKQQARDAINVLFGTAPRNSIAPKRSEFTMPTWQAVQQGKITAPAPAPAADPNAPNDAPWASEPAPWVGQMTPEMAAPYFDKAGFNKALTEFKGMHADAGKNKTTRDTLYDTVRENAFTAGQRALDEDYADARRSNRFELFARGLNGGSEDIDQSARERRVYSKGLLDLGARADAARAGFRANDEETRLQLLGAIDAGMDQGSALTSASNRMRIAADKAAADAQGTALGDVFNNAGLLYDNGQYALGRQAGQQAWWQSYQPPGGRRNSTGATGVTTRLPGE